MSPSENASECDRIKDLVSDYLVDHISCWLAIFLYLVFIANFTNQANEDSLPATSKFLEA
jgi:hypothetical protein